MRRTTTFLPVLAILFLITNPALGDDPTPEKRGDHDFTPEVIEQLDPSQVGPIAARMLKRIGALKDPKFALVKPKNEEPSITQAQAAMESLRLLFEKTPDKTERAKKLEKWLALVGDDLTAEKKTQVEAMVLAALGALNEDDVKKLRKDADHRNRTAKKDFEQWAALRELKRRIKSEEAIVKALRDNGLFKRYSDEELLQMITDVRKGVDLGATKPEEAAKKVSLLIDKVGNLPQDDRTKLAQLVTGQMAKADLPTKDKKIWAAFAFAVNPWTNIDEKDKPKLDIPEDLKEVFPENFQTSLTTEMGKKHKAWVEESGEYHEKVNNVFEVDEDGNVVLARFKDGKRIKPGEEGYDDAEPVSMEKVAGLRGYLSANYDADELTQFAQSMLASDKDKFKQIGAKLMAAMGAYVPPGEGEEGAGDPRQGDIYVPLQRTALDDEQGSDDQAFKIGENGRVNVAQLSNLLDGYDTDTRPSHGVSANLSPSRQIVPKEKNTQVHSWDPTQPDGKKLVTETPEAIAHSDVTPEREEAEPEETVKPEWQAVLEKQCGECHTSGKLKFFEEDGDGYKLIASKAQLSQMMNAAVTKRNMPEDQSGEPLSDGDLGVLTNWANANCAIDATKEKKDGRHFYDCTKSPKKEAPATTEPVNQEVHLPDDETDAIHDGVQSCSSCHGESQKSNEDRLFWIDETSGKPVIKPTKPGAKMRPIVERMAEVLEDPEKALPEGSRMLNPAKGRAKHATAFRTLADQLAPSDDGKHFVRGSEPVKREDDDEGTGGKDNGDGRTPGDDNGTQATWESLNDGAAGIKLAASLKGGNCAGCHGVNDDGGRPFQIDTDTNGNPTRFRFKGKDSKEASLALLKAVLQTGDVKMPKKTSVETEQPRLSRGQISAFAEWAKSKGVDLSTVKAGDSQFKIVRPVLPDIPLFVSLPTEIPRRWNGTQLTDNARVGLVVQGPSGSLFVRQANGSFAPIPDTKTFVTTDELNPQLPPGTSPSCSGPGDPKCKSMGFNVRNGRIEGGLIAAPSIP